jgi:4-amino-4-deoxychorismate lyase
MHALALLNQPSRDAPPHAAGAPPFRLVDPDGLHLSVLDLGVTRGDGIFETISAGHGRPQALDAHLRRFAASASALELPIPDSQAWRDAILAVISELGDVPEAFVKTVYTRGIEGDGRPTGWVHGSHSPDLGRVRVDGVRVVTLDRGYRHDVATTSPWLLAGAKTLSYAVNRAVIREARRRDADDVIFVSSDGYILEGPTSTVLLRRGNVLMTPGTGLAILEGTTQGSIFGFAEANGYETGFELSTVEDLHTADAIWLVSSVRHAAPVTALDGVPVAIDRVMTVRINEFLQQRQE